MTKKNIIWLNVIIILFIGLSISIYFFTTNDEELRFTGTVLVAGKDYIILNTNQEDYLIKEIQKKDNLQKQAEIYAAANNNPHIIKVILYFTKEEEQRIINILKELHLYENENIILIDARKDNKQSASKVKK